jgi:hypothetical protein
VGDEKYRSRKWQLAVFTSIAAATFLAFGKLSGGEWMAVQMAVVGVYNYANVKDPK